LRLHAKVDKGAKNMLVLQNQDPFTPLDTFKETQKSCIDHGTNKGRQFLNLGFKENSASAGVL